jgi:lipopolysaccharide export system permease protein
LPLIVFGLFITAISIYFNGWVVPKSNSEKFTIERNYLDKNRIAGLIQNLHIQDSENHIITIGSYNESEKTGTNASVQIFNDKNLSKLDYRIDAKIMKWDSIRNDWKMMLVTKREFESSELEKITSIDSVFASELPEIQKIYLSPLQIINKQLKPEELLLSEQEGLIKSMEESGQVASRPRVDYYSKISFPFANVIVILFGISISTNKRKSGAALQFGFSILIAFVYLGFTKVSQTLGYNGEISPVLTAWLANILFLSLAIFNLVRKQIFWK